jgi:hypothetical protein
VPVVHTGTSDVVHTFAATEFLQLLLRDVSLLGGREKLPLRSFLGGANGKAVRKTVGKAVDLAVVRRPRVIRGATTLMTALCEMALQVSSSLCFEPYCVCIRSIHLMHQSAADSNL